jgi:hypothetical protein
MDLGGPPAAGVTYGLRELPLFRPKHSDAP